MLPVAVQRAARQRDSIRCAAHTGRQPRGIRTPSIDLRGALLPSRVRTAPNSSRGSKARRRPLPDRRAGATRRKRPASLRLANQVENPVRILARGRLAFSEGVNDRTALSLLVYSTVTSYMSGRLW